MSSTESQPRARVPSLSPLPRIQGASVRGASKNWLARLLIVALIGASLWIALDQFRSPETVSADAPADVFSAERAMVHLAAIAQTPHPAGSAAHDAVEQYLIEQLTSMGLSPVVEATTGVSTTESGDVWAGRAQNIVARIPGTASSGALLLASHYDSVPTGPGAGDCGSCVVSVLETVRALQASAPLRNDVIVLLADAEEHDMLGAKAFMAEHPWAADVRVAINFEAIGTRGASMMNYVGPDSGELTSPVLKSLPHPLVSSFMSSLGLGNDTVQYVAHGAAGYEFVIFGGVQSYHSQLDSVSRVDTGGIQQNGDNLLALARTLGERDLTTNPSGEQVFFNVTRGNAVHYPAGWALPLALVPVLLFAALMGVGLRRRNVTVGAMLLGSTSFVGGVVVAVVLVTLTEWMLSRIVPNFGVFMGGSGYRDGLRLLAFVSLVALVMLAAHAWIRGRISALNLISGAMLVWALLAVATSILFTPVSYLFTFPLLGAVLAFGLLLLTGAQPARADDWRSLLAVTVALIPAVLLLAPVVIWGHAVITYVELPTRLPLAAVPVLFVALGLGLVVAFLPLPNRTWRWTAPGAAGLVTVGFLIAAIAFSGFGTSQPRPDSVAYVLDADIGQAQWVSVGSGTDAWTRQFFVNGSHSTTFAPLPSELPDMKLAARAADAPLVDLPAPVVTQTSNTARGSERTLTFHVTSPRHAPNMQLVLRSDSGIAGLSIDGKQARIGGGTGSGEPLTMQYYAVPTDGFDLEVVTNGAAPLRIAVEERSNGLPDVPGMTIQPRPASTMPAPFENADPTIVRKTFTF